MLRFLLILILVAVALRAFNRLFAGILEGAGYRREITPGVKLARDPVCGVYVVPAQALTDGSGQQVQYFCSERCRNKWRDGRAEEWRGAAGR
jgi:YHS domain-containing protein